MAKMLLTAKDIGNRAAWLIMRQTGIGGSDAAAIVGLSRWKSQFSLWQEKRGEVDPPDISDNECVYWGHVLEQVVADRFCELTGKKVRKTGLWADDEYNYLLASPDRLLVGENAGLECKTANGFTAKEWDGDEVPDAYYVQCQHYMSVMRADRWYIAVLIGGQKFVWKTIERNDDDIAALRAAEIGFWRKVTSGEMPPVDGTQSCTDALNARFAASRPDEIKLGADSEKIVRQIMQSEESKKQLETAIAADKNLLREKLGEYEVGRAGDFKITWRASKPRVSFDAKTFKEKMPEVYQKFTKISAPIRTLRIS